MDKARENRARRAAQRQGRVLVKSRVRDPRAIGYGTWEVVKGKRRRLGDLSRGKGVSLDEVERFLWRAQGGGPMGSKRVKQIEDAYREMVERARYRPAAPSDGLGNVAVPLEELDLEAEARDYAERWLAEEDRHEFYVGVPDYSTAVPMVWTIEAARLMCGMPEHYARAVTLLEMAAERLRGEQEEDR